MLTVFGRASNLIPGQEPGEERGRRRSRRREPSYPPSPQGRAILLGLELLLAGDIIRTVAIEPTFASVGVLAAIVAIRTFLSFSLQLELEGRPPWRGRTGAATLGSSPAR